MECISALSQACPRVSDLWLSVEEEVAWTVDQAAVHHQEGRAAGQSSRSLLVDEYLLEEPHLLLCAATFKLRLDEIE